MRRTVVCRGLPGSATVDHLVRALDKQGPGERAEKELLAALGPMKTDIVGR